MRAWMSTPARSVLAIIVGLSVLAVAAVELWALPAPVEPRVDRRPSAHPIEPAGRTVHSQIQYDAARTLVPGPSHEDGGHGDDGMGQAVTLEWLGGTLAPLEVELLTGGSRVQAVRQGDALWVMEGKSPLAAGASITARLPHELSARITGITNQHVTVHAPTVAAIEVRLLGVPEGAEWFSSANPIDPAAPVVSRVPRPENEPVVRWVDRDLAAEGASAVVRYPVQNSEDLRAGETWRIVSEPGLAWIVTQSCPGFLVEPHYAKAVCPGVVVTRVVRALPTITVHGQRGVQVFLFWLHGGKDFLDGGKDFVPRYDPRQGPLCIGSRGWVEFHSLKAGVPFPSGGMFEAVGCCPDGALLMTVFLTDQGGADVRLDAGSTVPAVSVDLTMPANVAAVYLEHRGVFVGAHSLASDKPPSPQHDVNSKWADLFQQDGTTLRISSLDASWSAGYVVGAAGNIGRLQRTARAGAAEVAWFPSAEALLDTSAFSDAGTDVFYTLSFQPEGGKEWICVERGRATIGALGSRKMRACLGVRMRLALNPVGAPGSIVTEHPFR
jgi:hypothetical protein